MIPKGYTLGKFPKITDLSFPPGVSVNSASDSDIHVFSLSYVSVYKIAEVIVCLGVWTLTTKVNIKAAYHLVPSSPQ